MNTNGNPLRITSLKYGEASEAEKELMFSIKEMQPESEVPKVFWNSSPPEGMARMTHKFSFLDAIERASVLMRTNPSEDKEELIVGTELKALIVLLPMFIQEDITDGLFPKAGNLTKLGRLGHRNVLYDISEKMDKLGCLRSTKRCALLQIEEEEKPAWVHPGR